MSDFVFKAHIEFEDSEQARELAALLTYDDEEGEDKVKEAFHALGEIHLDKRSGDLSTMLGASRRAKKGFFEIREAALRGDAVHVLLEGAGDAAWLMGLGLVMLAEETGGALLEGTLKDPKKDKAFDLIYNGEQARYDETIPEPEEEEEEDDDDEEYGLSDDDFDEGFRDDEF